MLICALPFFCVLRTTTKARPFHVVKCSEVEGSRSLRSAEAADISYGANPEEQAVQRDRIALVRRIIDQLPEKQRTVMQLRDMENKSYRDIAAIMGISEEQVKVNIFRARQTIKKEFLKQERYGL